MQCEGIFLTASEAGAKIDVIVVRTVGRELCKCGRVFLYFKS